MWDSFQIQPIKPLPPLPMKNSISDPLKDKQLAKSLMEPLSQPFKNDLQIQPIKPIPPIPKQNYLDDPLKDKQFTKPYMEPIISNPGQWEQNTASYMHKDIQRTITQSFPNASDIYAQKKLENDILKSMNTMVSVGTAAGGNPLSVAAAVNNVVHNFGPQTGAIQDTTGGIGGALFVGDTILNVAEKNYFNAGVGIMNHALGNYVDNQKKMLMEPITTSNFQPYHFKINDGFTSIEGKGSVSVIDTYTPPKAIRPFGPPDIFEGSTNKITKIQDVTTIKTGKFNNDFQLHTYSPPIIQDYKIPNYTPKFDSPRFDSSSFKYNNFNFGRMR
jgi:hypothetical protein